MLSSDAVLQAGSAGQPLAEIESYRVVGSSILVTLSSEIAFSRDRACPPYRRCTIPAGHTWSLASGHRGGGPPPTLTLHRKMGYPSPADVIPGWYASCRSLGGMERPRRPQPELALGSWCPMGVGTRPAKMVGDGAGRSVGCGSWSRRAGRLPWSWSYAGPTAQPPDR